MKPREQKSYYQLQLDNIPLTSVYAPIMQIAADKNCKTNWLGLNTESIPTIIRWLQDLLKIQEGKEPQVNEEIQEESQMSKSYVRCTKTLYMNGYEDGFPAFVKGGRYELANENQYGEHIEYILIDESGDPHLVTNESIVNDMTDGWLHHFEKI